MDRYCPKCFEKFAEGVERCPEHDIPVVTFTDRDLTGETLDDRYRIHAVIGRGGMGVIYRAEQLLIGRTVALKVLHKEVVRSEMHLKRFLREAKAMASLSNPHTVTLHDFGATSEGLLYYTMELLDGKPLSEVIRDEAPLEWRRAIDFVLQCCSSLEEAHRNGILHRDIKPDNLFVISNPRDRSEFLKVLDFGIAKVLGDPTLEKLTQTGLAIGTPAYVSPEQILSKSAGPASDLYSLAVVLFEMVAGRPPFTGGSPMEVLLKHLNEMPQPLPKANPSVDLPKELQRVVARALSKEPGSRYETVEDFRQALVGLTTGTEVWEDEVEEAEHTSGGDPAMAATPAAVSIADGEVLLAPLRPQEETLGLPESTTDAPSFESVGRRGGLWRGLVASLAVVVAIGAIVAFLVALENYPEPEGVSVAGGRGPAGGRQPHITDVESGGGDGVHGAEDRRPPPGPLPFRRIAISVRLESLVHSCTKAEHDCAGAGGPLETLAVLRKQTEDGRRGLAKVESAEELGRRGEAEQMMADLEKAYSPSWFSSQDDEVRRVADSCLEPKDRMHVETVSETSEDVIGSSGSRRVDVVTAPEGSAGSGAGGEPTQGKVNKDSPTPRAESHASTSAQPDGDTISTRPGKGKEGKPDRKTEEAWLELAKKWKLMDARIVTMREKLGRVEKACKGRLDRGAQVSGLRSVLRALETKLKKVQDDIRQRAEMATVTDGLVLLSGRYDAQKDWFAETAAQLESACSQCAVEEGEDRKPE